MTAQRSDILINDSEVDLGWLAPYFVRRSDRSDAFPVRVALPESNLTCSSLWRGYVATMRLHADGRLELEKYEFPLAAEGTPPQICHTYFNGDFSVILRPFFYGPNTRIPFRDGRIARNPSEWEIENQTISGVVTSVARGRNTGKPIGLFVHVSCTAFAPRSLVPADRRDDLDALVGRTVRCSFHEIHEQHGIILQIEEIGAD